MNTIQAVRGVLRDIKVWTAVGAACPSGPIAPAITWPADKPQKGLSHTANHPSRTSSTRPHYSPQQGLFYIPNIDTPAWPLRCPETRDNPLCWLNVGPVLPVVGLKPYNAEIFMLKPWRPKIFFQFEIIINVLFSSFFFIWIPNWVQAHYNYFDSFSAGIVFIRQNRKVTKVTQRPFRQK